MKLAKTDEAKAALRAQLTEDARAAADENVLVSREEGEGLSPANRRAELALRAEGGKGTRVRADEIAARAASDAERVWDRFNERGPHLLSRAEVKAIGAADPAIAEATRRAYLTARGLGDPKAAVRRFFETFDFARMDALPGGRRVDARVGQPGRAEVPKGVLGGFDHYHRAEAQDWASVGLYEARVAGQPVWAVVTTTDGDDGYLEVYDRRGEPLTSARLFDRQLFAHDEFFGRARLSPSLLALDGARWQEGLSEPPERLAAGQVPVGWPGDVRIAKGEIHHEGRRFSHADLARDIALDPEQRVVFVAAMELLWDQVFQHRASHATGEPLRLGPGHQGVLRIGEFTRPDDGKTYLAADWRDIDDASYVFYFERAQDGLRLAIRQFDN